VLVFFPSGSVVACGGLEGLISDEKTSRPYLRTLEHIVSQLQFYGHNCHFVHGLIGFIRKSSSVITRSLHSTTVVNCLPVGVAAS